MKSMCFLLCVIVRNIGKTLASINHYLSELAQLGERLLLIAYFILFV